MRAAWGAWSPPSAKAQAGGSPEREFSGNIPSLNGFAGGTDTIVFFSVLTRFPALGKHFTCVISLCLQNKWEFYYPHFMDVEPRLRGRIQALERVGD